MSWEKALRTAVDKAIASHPEAHVALGRIIVEMAEALGEEHWAWIRRIEGHAIAWSSQYARAGNNQAAERRR